MAKLAVISIKLSEHKFKRGIIPKPHPVTGEPGQPVGDIVTIHDDDWVFSDTENELYEIIHIPGMTAQEVRDALPKLQMLKHTDKDLGGERDLWLDTSDNKYKKIEKRPWHEFSMANLTIQQKQTLTSGLTSKTQKQAVLSDCTNRIKELSENYITDSLTPTP